MEEISELSQREAPTLPGGSASATILKLGWIAKIFCEDSSERTDWINPV